LPGGSEEHFVASLWHFWHFSSLLASAWVLV